MDTEIPLQAAQQKTSHSQTHRYTLEWKRLVDELISRFTEQRISQNRVTVMGIVFLVSDIIKTKQLIVKLNCLRRPSNPTIKL